MVKINLKIEKKDLWLLSAIVVFMVGVGFVIAYNAGFSGGTPSVMGHSSDEIMVKNSTGSLITLQQFVNQSRSGGNLQSIQVVGITDITAPAAWADMQDMSVTMNTNGGDVLLTFSGDIYAPGNSDVVGDLRFTIDGNAKHIVRAEAGDGGWQESASMSWIEKGLSAGSHTFKIQWKGTNANVKQTGTTNPRVFSAIEL